jgi:signal transduction histidine kinase
VLRTRWPALAQLGWIGLAAAGVALSVAAAPAQWREFMEVCTAQASCPEPHLTTGRVHELSALGIPVAAFGGYLTAVAALWSLVYLGTGALILWRRPEQPVALLAATFLLTFGLGNSFLGAGQGPHGDIPLASKVFEFAGFASLLLFVFVFPGGRFTPGWTRWLAAAAIAWQVGETFFRGSRISSENWPRPLAMLPYVLILGVAVWSQVYKYRRVSDVQAREQVRWVVAGILATVAGFLFVGALNALQGSAPTNVFALLLEATAYYVVLLPLPVSIAVAILRHRLWGLDVVVNRALLYAVMSAVVVLIFVIVVGGLGRVAGGQNNLGLSLLATALAGILFQPLRDRVQRLVNRLIYGQRDEPYVALSQLGRQLEAAVDQETLLQKIVDTVAESLRLPYTGIALGHGDDYELAAVAGAPHGEAIRHPMVYRGNQVGELVLCPRLGEAAFSNADRRLLNDLARQAAVVAYAVRATNDVRRSRERLVVAREEERRRLRRDLHDGLGPSLASMTLMADAALNLSAENPDRAAELLRMMSSEAKAATSEVRRLVYQLRPPALDELGLLGAVGEHVERCRASIDITLCVPENLGAMPAAVEVAAYRIVQEALTNVIRHSRATDVAIRLETSSGELHLRVDDNGCGFDRPPPESAGGLGLKIMRYRAQMLGGDLTLGSGPNGGVSVRCSCPLDGVAVPTDPAW